MVKSCKWCIFVIWNCAFSISLYRLDTLFLRKNCKALLKTRFFRGSNYNKILLFSNILHTIQFIYIKKFFNYKCYVWGTKSPSKSHILVISIIFDLIADPPKIGTALLIKFGDNNDNKKKHFLHLAREISFTHPYKKIGYVFYKVFIRFFFLRNNVS